MSSLTSPPSRRQWKLRTRLAAGLGLLFLAILALVVISHFQYLNDRREARMEDIQRAGQTVAASLDGLTYDLESISLSTSITLGEAGTPIHGAVSEDVRKRVNDYLQHLFESHGLIRAIFITDPQGRVVYDNGGDSFGLDLSDRSYVQALQAGQTEFWSEGFPGSQTGSMVVAHSRAIVGPDGATTGYFVVVLRTEALVSRLPPGLTDEGHLSIVDRNGTLVLQAPGDGGVAVGADLSGWPALDAATANRGLVVDDEAMPLGAGDRYAALVPIDNLDWYVAYSLPAGAVEGATTDLFFRDVAVLGAIVLAAFAAMWIFSNQTVRPLTRLTDIASAISHGSEAEPPSVSSGGAEVVQLAETMRQMHIAIRQREDQLRSQAAAIEAIERLGESLATELDPDSAIEAIVQAGVEMVDADAVQFVRGEVDGGGRRTVVAGPRPSLALAEDDRLIGDVLLGEDVDCGDLLGASGTTPGVVAETTSARSVLGVPIRTRNGVVEGALLLLRADANAYSTDHRRMATGLARWACIVLENANLYRQSQELVAELARSNEAKSDFIGIVSHELRTPITTIYGGALLLRLRRENLPEQAFNDMIVSISEEAERLHHLVEDLLAIARTEVVREPTPVDVGEVLRALVGEFATSHRRVLQLDVAPGMPPAMADSSYLRQVVGNLISNADKYTAVDLPVEVSAAPEDGEVVVRVQDNGRGIDEAELPQIFESFYRSKDAVERASGSGLGLTVCKRLVEAMGGRIWASNRPEGGLEVGFTLRMAPSGQPADAPGNNGRLAGAPLANESVS